MAIDMKTATGGGVTLFVLSGSSSYLIANSVSEGEDSATSITNSETAQASTVQAKTTQTEEEMDLDESEEIEIEEACSEAFKKPIEDENQKSEVKTSCERLTLEGRAKQLNIALLVTTKKGNAEVLKARFNSINSVNSRKLYQFATDSSAIIDWNDSNTNDANLKVFCESVKKLSLGQTSGGSSQSIEKEWTNFLLACAQEENLSKDFWTGK